MCASFQGRDGSCLIELYIYIYIYIKSDNKREKLSDLHQLTSCIIPHISSTLKLFMVENFRAWRCMQNKSVVTKYGSLLSAITHERKN